ncbi:MAG: type VI secretion system tube protein Hcp [Methylococcaceae bacterium]|jgi:type VI secretion system secreted protein Hcp
MATSTYLKADPLKGEATDSAHSEWLEISSFGFGVSQPTSSPGGTLGNQARADFHVFSVSKPICSASIDLLQHCAKGTEIAKMELEVCQASDKKICYWKFEFEHVTVQSVSIGVGGSDRPMESVTFSYNLVKYTYKPIKDGAEGTAVGPKGWDLTKNDVV